MWFLLDIRNNKDLLTLKVFGYSNFKIFFIIALSAFILGWLILFLVNPLHHQCQNITRRLNQIILKI